MNVRKNCMQFMSLVAVFVLTACGGSGGSKGESPREIMSKKDGVTIIYGMPREDCESTVYQEEMRRRVPAYNLLFQVDSNDVTCQTYGKSHPKCGTRNIYMGDKSCVIGFDVKDKNYKQNKLFIAHEDILIETIMWIDETHK